ncbi:TPM domain-containing protein [Geofilum rubicundum]|uniref:TPM domain-containing protein n=1 Tax=Geofilum rubicundum JCM 15548 TaxID=1236989 RepID=A0A0E9LTI1_9BACT|nr:TPM domain-containing protein [Geofilum rubicundum]GAO28170.1 hypothetical protein JCM15548_234 [Geofilum rubicundum JCM 15548]
MAAKLFTEQEKESIVKAVKTAELNTSGEIRVHVERTCPEDVLDRAAFVFEKLKMHQTELRNGVLFYLTVDDHQMAVLGDAGINAKVPEGFWDEIKETMLGLFKQGDLAGGLEKGILMAGEQLKAFFPHQSDDVNELSDEISFGK